MYSMGRIHNKTTDDAPRAEVENGADKTMNQYARLLWILGIGWWLALIWLGVAILLMLTVVGWPLAYKMFDSTYTILTGDFA